MVITTDSTVPVEVQFPKKELAPSVRRITFFSLREKIR